MNTSPAHPDSPARRISVYIDPACPWTWVTAQWLREAAPRRNLGLRWRPLSLRLRDGDRPPPGAPAEIQALAVAARIQSRRLLRIFEALRAATRDGDIDRLYRRRGERVFAPPWPRAAPGLGVTGEVVTAAGLPASWAAGADDPSWDPAIAAAMTAAAAVCGPEPASPAIVLDGPPAAGLTGPVFTCAPAGPAALRTWDAVHTLRTEPGFTGLRRPRTSPAPVLSSHPPPAERA